MEGLSSELEALSPQIRALANKLNLLRPKKRENQQQPLKGYQDFKEEKLRNDRYDRYERERNDAIEYLDFAETYSNLTSEIQKQTLNTSNQALALNKNDIAHRMKLVMIYGLPSSSLLDTVKAQNLLQQVLQEDVLANSQLAFAHMLFDYLVAANKVSKNNIDDQKRVDSLQQKNEALQLKLEVLQQKLEASQQKLDALKKIEKSMGERDAKSRTAPTQHRHFATL